MKEEGRRKKTKPGVFHPAARNQRAERKRGVAGRGGAAFASLRRASPKRSGGGGPHGKLREAQRLTLRGVRDSSSGSAGRPASIHAAVMSDATPPIASDSRFSRIGFTFAKNRSKYL